MISYKRDVLERQSLSEVKMGRGSRICERVRKKIVEYFKNNVPQRQIAKALQISLSTVHNIIKSFRETGEISVRKGQGRRTLLDARGHGRHLTLKSGGARKKKKKKKYIYIYIF